MELQSRGIVHLKSPAFFFLFLFCFFCSWHGENGENERTETKGRPTVGIL